MGIKMKKAQMTIFIIIGIFVVVAVGLILVVRSIQKPSETSRIEEFNINSYMSSCLSDEIKEAANILLKNGGSLKSSLQLRYDYENITYLCFQRNGYLPCVQQQPMLFQHLKQEIKIYIQDEVWNCLESLKKNAKDEGYDFSYSYRDFNVELVPGKTLIDIDAVFDYKKGGEAKTQDGTRVIVSTRLYGIAEVVQEITRQEAEFCYFSVEGFRITYPNYEIKRTTLSDATKIYSVRDKRSDETFIFATRGCYLPAGLW